MVRDFTSESEEKLINLVKECRESTHIFDNCASSETWLKCYDKSEYLDVKESVEVMQNYYKAVVEKNDATYADIKNIYYDVYQTDNTYKIRFCALKQANDSFLNSINALRSVFKNKTITKTRVGDVRKKIESNKNAEKIYSRIAGEIGLLESDIETMDPDELNSTLFKLGDYYTAKCRIEKKWEVRIPLGPYIEYYYKLKVDGGAADANTYYELDDNYNINFKNFEGVIPLIKDRVYANGSSDGSMSLSGSSDHFSASVKTGEDGTGSSIGVKSGGVSINKVDDIDGYGFNATCKSGNETYTLKVRDNALCKKTEYIIESEPSENLKATATQGIVVRRALRTQRSRDWQFTAIPEEVVSPYIEMQSTWDEFWDCFDWKQTKQGLIITMCVAGSVAGVGLLSGAVAGTGAVAGSGALASSGAVAGSGALAGSGAAAGTGVLSGLGAVAKSGLGLISGYLANIGTNPNFA